MLISNYQNTKHGKKVKFTSNIEFTASQVIKNELRRGVHVSLYDDFTVDAAKRALKIGTTGVYDCIAGGITGGNTNNNLVFHLMPSGFFDNLRKNLAELEQKFKETVSLSKQEHKTPQGLIFGGYIGDDSDCKQSKDLCVILKHFFDKFKIDCSVFWGSPYKQGTLCHQKNIYYDGKTDTWLVNLLKLDKNGKKDVLSKQQIIDAFSQISISPQDKVKFPDTDWISGRDADFNKDNLDLIKKDVLKKYRIED